MTTNLYEFIRKRCGDLGISMSQLQDRTGLSWGILSGIKNGKGIRAGTKQKLAEGLLCSIGDIQAALSLDAAAQKKKVKGEEDMKAYPITPEPTGEEKQPSVMEAVDRLEAMVKEEYPKEVQDKLDKLFIHEPTVEPKVKEKPKETPREFVIPAPLRPFIPAPEPDNVNRPAHYTQGGIECIDAIKAAMTPEAFRGFLKGNIQKYVWRYEKKNGLEDLKKARWYLDRLIGEMEELNCDKGK